MYLYRASWIGSRNQRVLSPSGRVTFNGVHGERANIQRPVFTCGKISHALGTKSQPHSQRGLRVHGRVDDIGGDRHIRALAELGSIGFGDLWCALHYQRNTAPLNHVSGVRD